MGPNAACSSPGVERVIFFVVVFRSLFVRAGVRITHYLRHDQTSTSAVSLYSTNLKSSGDCWLLLPIGWIPSSRKAAPCIPLASRRPSFAAPVFTVYLEHWFFYPVVNRDCLIYARGSVENQGYTCSHVCSLFPPFFHLLPCFCKPTVKKRIQKGKLLKSLPFMSASAFARPLLP